MGNSNSSNSGPITPGTQVQQDVYSNMETSDQQNEIIKQQAIEIDNLTKKLNKISSTIPEPLPSALPAPPLSPSALPAPPPPQSQLPPNVQNTSNNLVLLREQQTHDEKLQNKQLEADDKHNSMWSAAKKGLGSGVGLGFARVGVDALGGPRTIRVDNVGSLGNSNSNVPGIPNTETPAPEIPGTETPISDEGAAAGFLETMTAVVFLIANEVVF